MFKEKDKNNALTVLKMSYLFFAVHSAAIMLYTYVFHGEMAEYYLIPVFCFLFIILGSSLYFLTKTRLKLPVYALLFVFAWLNTEKVLISNNSYSLRNKTEAVKFSLDSVSQNNFMLDSFQTCWYSGGYRYLYTYLEREPLTSYMDQYLSEYYIPDTKTKPEYKVTILAPELIGEQPQDYNNYRREIIKNADSYRTFGAIEVFIQKI
jgi:hypothetical protein